MKKFLCAVCVICGSLSATAQIQTNAGIQYLQCMPKDQSGDFSDLSNTYFLADSLASFDGAKGEGLLNWKRYRMTPRQAFNLNGYWPVRMQMLDFPDTQYDHDPNLSFKIACILSMHLSRSSNSSLEYRSKKSSISMLDLPW